MTEEFTKAAKKNRPFFLVNSNNVFCLNPETLRGKSVLDVSEEEIRHPPPPTTTTTVEPLSEDELKNVSSVFDLSKVSNNSYTVYLLLFSGLM